MGTVPCHCAVTALSPAGPGSARLPQTPKSNSVGGPLQPCWSNPLLQSAGLELSLSTGEGRKEESHFLTEVALTAVPLLVLEFMGVRRLSCTHGLSLPCSCLAWGCIRAPLCDPGLHNTHTLERFSAPNLSTVGTEPF